MTLDKITEKIDKAFDVKRLPFRRNMTEEEIRKLQRACSLAFSTDIHPQVIEKIMHYCYYVERGMKGRAAGNIEDLIIRYLLRYFSSLNETGEEKNQCHLEIGSLFGAVTIFSCHAVQLAEKEFLTVVIDPFEGYYGQDLDIVTKLKADEETFWSNLRQFGFQEDMVRVVKGLSTDEEIIKHCKKLKVPSLIIDGDHSYDGIKSDWINYSPLVVPGGYVLIDDYLNTNWPEVTKFVNNEVFSMLAGKWEVVLVYGYSLILKRTDVKESEETEYVEQLFHRLKDKERIIEKQNDTIEGLEKEMNGQIMQRDNQIHMRDNQIHMMKDSWSWKITAPLRWLGKFASKSTKKGD